MTGFGKPITVILAEDHTVVREGLRALLAMDSGIEVIAEAQSGREAVEKAKMLRPDVVVMDIAMPLLNGVEATRQIRQALPATKVLILSAHGDDEYVEQVMSLGASGYLVKQSSANLLAQAVRDVHKGKTVFSPSIAKRMRTRYEGGVRRGAPVPRAVRLTSREVEVLQLVAEGKANKQIAAELGISIKTVEKHRQHVMAKLDLHDTAGLTRYAIAAGIIESRVQVTIE